MSITATPANAAHLLRRATFGGNADELAAAISAGIEATVERLLDFTRAPAVSQPPGLPDIAGQMDGKVDAKTAIVQRWWLDRMAKTPTPTLEKLTYLWHWHFATSVEKVSSDVLMWRQNATLRQHAAGGFRALLHAIARDPALLIWLDAPDSTAEAPNENFARELMELFTLGRGRGYTELDVREAARAFTGWSVDDHEDGHGTYFFRYVADDHDDGEKTIFGRRGRWSGNDVLDMLLDRPECKAHIAGRLWRRYTGRMPEPAVLADLVAALDSTLSIAGLLRRIFTYPLFYEPPQHLSLVSSPTEFVVRSLRAFALTCADLPDVLDYMEAMNQVLFAPPNVGGWGDRRYWTSSAASAARIDFAHAFGQALADRAARGGHPATPLLRLVQQPDRLLPLLFARCGVPDPSTTSLQAVRSYRSSERDAQEQLATAVALTLLSREVQLL